MSSMLRLLILALAIGSVGPVPVSAQGPRLEVTFIQWIPGTHPLRETDPPFRPGDNDILIPYRVAGTIVATVEVSVESPTGLDSRMVFFLPQPVTPDSQSVRLPVPESGLEFVRHESEKCWSMFPGSAVHRYEHFVTLTMPSSDQSAGDRRMTYEIVGANGDVKTGVAARWPITASSDDAIQQARATERAHRNLTDTSTAVARAR